MSPVVVVQAGQCGNQVGYNLYDSLYNHLYDPDEDVNNLGNGMEEYFRPASSASTGPASFFDNMSNSGADSRGKSGSNKYYARSVCIDTEPKVVNNIMNKSHNHKNAWSYVPSNILYRHGGAGNNWALGYQMCSGEFLEESLNSIRKELEMCDQNASILTTHSTAGGTGSGLGTRMTEAIADEFPTSTRVNIAIAPYHFGEVVVQHYNSVLCLSKISASSDAVILFENEVCKQLCHDMWRLDSPSIDDINKTIVANIIPSLLPKYSYEMDSRGLSYRKSSLSGDVLHLCSHPYYRFLDIKSTPQTSVESVDFTYDSWHSITNTLGRMMEQGKASERQLKASYRASDQQNKNKNIGSILTLRGPDAFDNEIKPDQFGQSGQSSSASNSRFSDLLRDPVKVYHSPHATNGYLRSASLLTNGQGVLPVLERSTSKASKMFQAGAYVHQYENFGLEKEDIVTCMRTLGQVIENYRSI